MNRESILEMASGAIKEKVDYEVSRVIENILDPNTKPDAKRKIVITLEMIPDSERTHIAMNASVKSTLCPLVPTSTAMTISTDGNGELAVVELTPHIPGQINMSGEEQPQPKILKLVATK